MAALSLEQAPPIWAPVRFFLTAPIFGAAAGALLALRADAVTASRWTSDSLAVVHLLVLGFMLQVMAGALLQFLPVAAGASIWRPTWVAGVTHPGLALGAVLLVAGFLGAGPVAMQAAAVVLGCILACYVTVIAVALARAPAIGPTLLSLRVAIAGLAITAGLGVTLAGTFGWGWGLPLIELTAVHAAWGLLGWGVVLVAGVAGLVVPMFQLTPAYPVAFARAVPRVLAGALVAWSAGIAFASRPVAWAGAIAAAGAVIAFAGVTLRLQARRKRKIVDTTFHSWRVGMVCLLLAAPLGLWLLAGPPDALRPRLEYLLGVLLLAGAFPAVIGGMLYKIVPFLCWLHLQRVMRGAPHMGQVLAEKWARRQTWLFGAALAFLLAGAGWTPLVSVGGWLFCASYVALELNLIAAMRFYVRKAAEAPGIPEPERCLT